MFDFINAALLETTLIAHSNPKATTVKPFYIREKKNQQPHNSLYSNGDTHLMMSPEW